MAGEQGGTVEDHRVSLSIRYEYYDQAILDYSMRAGVYLCQEVIKNTNTVSKQQKVLIGHRDIGNTSFPRITVMLFGFTDRLTRDFGIVEVTGSMVEWLDREELGGSIIGKAAIRYGELGIPPAEILDEDITNQARAIAQNIRLLGAASPADFV